MVDGSLSLRKAISLRFSLELSAAHPLDYVRLNLLYCESPATNFIL